MFPLNLTGFVYPGYPGFESPQERAALVCGVSKPFVLMKALAAGRIPPQEALPFVFQHGRTIWFRPDLAAARSGGDGASFRAVAVLRRTREARVDGSPRAPRMAP
jgi:hypothetical protein